MSRIGIEALYRRPRTTKPERGHKIFPYLLRGVVSTPERKCIGGPEQKSLSQASKKAPDIGGLLAFGGLSPGYRRRVPCRLEAGVICAWSV
jgi:hypothetical protein